MSLTRRVDPTPESQEIGVPGGMDDPVCRNSTFQEVSEEDPLPSLRPPPSVAPVEEVEGVGGWDRKRR